MNKKELVRYLEKQKIDFVATQDDVEAALIQVTNVAQAGGNVPAAVFMYHNTLLQSVINAANGLDTEVAHLES